MVEPEPIRVRFVKHCCRNSSHITTWRAFEKDRRAGRSKKLGDITVNVTADFLRVWSDLGYLGFKM